MEQTNKPKGEADAVIIADADYIDRLAVGIAAHFGKMLGRPVQPADMAVWAECVALDGGLREGNNLTQVVLVHEKETRRLRGFVPSDITAELNGKAFSGNLGEFQFMAVSTEGMTGKAELCADIASLYCLGHGTRHVMIVTDTRKTLDTLRQMLRDTPKEKQITLFGMEKPPEDGYRGETVGFSLLHALGIKPEEIKN